MMHPFSRPVSAAFNTRAFLAPVARAFALLTGLAFLVTVSSVAQAGSWQGQEVDKDGVVHVMNPATAMEEPTEVELKELWRLGGDTDDEDEFFGIIMRITTDAQGNVYLLDGQLAEVKIYSPDGEYLNTIGREGEGPGEFRRPGDMFILPDGNVGVMQTVPGKIVQLTADGDPAGEFPIPEPEGGGFQILRGGQLAGQNLALQRMTQVLDQENAKADLVFTIDLVSAEGELLANMEQKISTLQFANAVITEETFDTFENRWTVGEDGRVYACPKRDDYYIKVWSPEGKLERVITRDAERYKRSEDDKKDIERIWSAFLQRVPDPDFRVSDYDKDISNIYVRDDGSIWVLTGTGRRDQPDDVIGVFDVLDSDGHFVRNVTLRGQGDALEDAFFFDGDRMYVVTGFLNAAIAAQGGSPDEEEEDVEEDPTPMEVICYRVDAPVLAKGN